MLIIRACSVAVRTFSFQFRQSLDQVSSLTTK
uniref:Uncharacterized protein n=1 Tax=Arundo donax TaxID=35708 RepID=A0A0A8Y5A8_ARUDO